VIINHEPVQRFWKPFSLGYWYNVFFIDVLVVLCTVKPPTTARPNRIRRVEAIGLGLVDGLMVIMAGFGFEGKLAALGDAKTARAASVALCSYSLTRRHSFVISIKE
jgi:hypothetical protein